MEYTQIPNLAQNASRVGLGTWAVGGTGWGGADKKESIDTIFRALDLGVNLIDTAPAYGYGLSEEIVGEALKKYGRRDKIIVATKVGLSWKENRLYRDASRESIFREIEDSLKRLQLEYIDIYQVHWPDPRTPLAETAEAMRKLLKDGKIRAIGVSNFTIEMMNSFQKIASLHVLQPPFNLFEREIEEKELVYCKERGIATLGYGSLCRGLLSGAMHEKREFSGDDIRKEDPKFQQPYLAGYLNASECLKKWVQKKYNKSLLALAVRWALDKGINVALWGGRRPEQFDQLEEVSDWSLSEEDFKQIDVILEESLQEKLGPEFMAPPPRKANV